MHTELCSIPEISLYGYIHIPEVTILYSRLLQLQASQRVSSATWAAALPPCRSEGWSSNFKFTKITCEMSQWVQEHRS